MENSLNQINRCLYSSCSTELFWMIDTWVNPGFICQKETSVFSPKHSIYFTYYVISVLPEQNMTFYSLNSVSLNKSIRKCNISVRNILQLDNEIKAVISYYWISKASVMSLVKVIYNIQRYLPKISPQNSSEHHL